MVKRYSSKVGTQTGTLYKGSQVAPSLMGEAIKVLEEVGHNVQKEALQQEALDYKTAETNVEQALIAKEFELNEQIKNGNYAGADAEFSDFYEQQMAGLYDMVKDPAYRQDMGNRFKSAYTPSVLRLRSNSNTARKADYIDSANNELALLGEKYMVGSQVERSNVIGQADRIYSDQLATGVISQGEYEIKTRMFLRDAEMNRITAVGMQDPELGLAELESTQKGSGLFDELTYQTEVAKYNKVIKAAESKASDSAKLMVKDSANPTTLSANEVDTKYNMEVTMLAANGQDTPENVFASVVKISNTNLKLPRQVTSAAQSYMSLDPSEVTPETAQQSLYYAEMLTSSGASAQATVDNDTMSRARMMKGMVANGTPVELAAKRVATIDVANVTPTQRTNISESFYKAKKSGIPSAAKKNIINAATYYSAGGMDSDTAVNAAIDEYEGLSGEFLGKNIPYSPSSVFPVADADKLQSLAKETYINNYVASKGGAIGTGEARKQAKANAEGLYLYPSSATIKSISEGRAHDAEWIIYRDVKFGDKVIPMTDGEVISFTEEDVKPESSWIDRTLLNYKMLSNQYLGTDYLGRKTSQALEEMRANN